MASMAVSRGSRYASQALLGYRAFLASGKPAYAANRSGMSHVLIGYDYFYQRWDLAVTTVTRSRQTLF
jgi:hypothetical protein